MKLGLPFDRFFPYNEQFKRIKALRKVIHKKEENYLELIKIKPKVLNISNRFIPIYCKKPTLNAPLSTLFLRSFFQSEAKKTIYPEIVSVHPNITTATSFPPIQTLDSR